MRDGPLRVELGEQFPPKAAIGGGVIGEDIPRVSSANTHQIVTVAEGNGYFTIGTDPWGVKPSLERDPDESDA